MPKRIDWLPYGIPERALALRRIANGAESYGALVGLTPAEIDRLNAIADEYAFAATLYENNKRTLKALRAWRDDVMSNERPIKAVAERPMFDNSPMPVGTQRGLIAEIRMYVRRIKAAGGFSEMIGKAMHILPPNHVKKSLSELKPKLKVTAIHGFKVKIRCEMEGMTAIQIEFRRNGEERFEKVAFLTSLPETIYIEPRVAGVPETGQMRAIFIKKNKIVGDYSNMPSITIFGT
ncbi:MAG TPA: hypothetical protein PLL77_11695 [Pyrinomonadaceae bacterium]|nr:hypothetical protein [Pyrinomonadaceae bacterium]